MQKRRSRTRSVRCRRGVNRLGDASATMQEAGWPSCSGHGPPVHRPCPYLCPGGPCARRMIPLESPVPEIGTPGSVSGDWKRGNGSRTEMP